MYTSITPRPTLLKGGVDTHTCMQLIVVLPSVAVGRRKLQVGLIAFGVAALLYLVTEELLVEVRESPFVCLCLCLRLCVRFVWITHQNTHADH